MSTFCLLSDPENYVADDWDISAASDSGQYWLDLFAAHFKETLSHAAHRYGRSARRRIEAAGQDFTKVLDAVGAEVSDSGEKLTVMKLCRLREKVLRDNDLADPFAHIRQHHNDEAIELYGDLVHDLHVMPTQAKWQAIIEGVFAGNIFDLGATTTMHLADEVPNFMTTLDELRPRPWLVDDFDRLADDLPRRPPPKWTKAVVFVDNAGSDFVLGMMPLMRELALAGTQIVLAANELPTLNDITADEAADVVERLAAIDADLRALLDGEMLTVVSSGNDIPLIDLAQASDELNEAAIDADLVILEGMGRAIESNFDTPMTVDCLRLALLKDAKVAARIGGEVFDCVCKYTPKTTAPPDEE